MSWPSSHPLPSRSDADDNSRGIHPTVARTTRPSVAERRLMPTHAPLLQLQGHPQDRQKTRESTVLPACFSVHLAHLRLRDFRNYHRLDADFLPGFLLLLGGNAQG